MASSPLLFLLLLWAATILVQSQEESCEPGPVFNLTLRGNNSLTWSISADEECVLSYYLVEVTDVDGSVHSTYTVLDPVVHIDHLERCERYTFRVFQVSTDNVTGPGSAIHQVTPPDSEANLALESLSLAQEGRNVRLTWSLQDEFIRCARHYRVVVLNTQTSATYDIYTSLTSILVHSLVPCANYIITVRGIFTLEDEGPMRSVAHTAAAVVNKPPELAGMSIDSTEVTLTWHLEDYWENNCRIYSIIIDGSPYFSLTYSIRDQTYRRSIPIKLTSLAPDALYYLRVFSNNTAGASDPIAIAIQTLPSS